MLKGFVAVLLLALLLIPCASAISIEVTPDEQTVKVGQEAKFSALLVNDGGDEEFYLFIKGRPAHWINLGSSYMEIPAQESMTVPITFYPNDMGGSYSYEVVMQSAARPQLKATAGIDLEVMGEKKKGVASGFDASREGQNVRMSVLLSSAKETEIALEFSLSDGARTLATKTVPVEFSGEKNLSITLELPQNPQAGTYTASMLVKGRDISFEKQFTVEAVREVVTDEEESTNPLFHEVRINVANRGNVVEKDYRLISNVPTGFVTFVNQPEECEGETCEWTLSRINPQESLEIVYRIEYWPLLSAGLIIAIVIGGLVFFGTTRFGKPVITKSIEGPKDGLFTTVLEVKNSSNRISNVVVSDRVSPLLKVEKDFETVKPVVKEGEEGTELMWNLQTIEPKDHRIIHYRTKPIINGKLVVPAAELRYITGKKRYKAQSAKKQMTAS